MAEETIRHMKVKFEGEAIIPVRAENHQEGVERAENAVLLNQLGPYLNVRKVKSIDTKSIETRDI